MLKPMRVTAIALLLATPMLTSCATYDGVVHAHYYDGYYDGYYGPYLGGYWANDGLFWYEGPDRHYYPDRERHFRHDRFPDSRHIRGDRGWRIDRRPPGNRDGPHAPGRDQRPPRNR